MFLGQIERECLDEENWSLWQKTKLPDHLQLLVDQEQIKSDIWELQTKEPSTARRNSKFKMALSTFAQRVADRG
ncbi:MAG: hypothetical protein V7K50_23300 [Nostoc sp.]|uniref:hypothetical protein n=1 Tax=Nostoc sp. TaxID=1180 RepID=UPI002FFA1049